MSDLDLDLLKRRINIKDYIERAYDLGKETKTATGSLYKNCPICKSSSNKRGDNGHFLINENTQSYSSFSGCCKGGDVIKFVEEFEGISFLEAKEKLCRYANIDLKNKSNNVEKNQIMKNKKEKNQKMENKEELKENVEEVIEKATKTNNRELLKEYIEKRGLSLEKAEKYNIVVSKELTGRNRIIIPVTTEGKIVSYVSRAVEDNDFIRYKNSKCEVYLFNSDYLKEEPGENKRIYICEGIFDALSIEETGEKAIAINSTSNIEKLIKKISENEKVALQYQYIIALDTDKTGEKARKKLEEELKKINAKTYMLEIPKKYIDINEWLLNITTEELKTKIIPFENETVLNYINNKFYNDILRTESYKSRKTGFKNLDNIIKIIPGLYVIGAVSSLGKTTFMLQLAEQMAELGEKIIFFSLEQSTFELISKGLSRQTYNIDPFRALNNLQIMQNSNISDITCEAMKKYQAIANNMIIKEGIFNTGVAEIREYIKEYIESTGTKPIVIIDYLQILKPISDRQTDKQAVDYNISELKRISRDYEVPIFTICSLNRQSYLSQIDFSAFKESGSIEYGADVVLGLQFKDIHLAEEEKSEPKKRAIMKTARNKIPREIELVVLKNRNGKTNDTMQLKFYPMYNCYIEE